MAVFKGLGGGFMNNYSPYGRIHISYDNYGPGVQRTVKMTRREKLVLSLTAGVIGLCIIMFHYFGDLFVEIARKTPIMEYYNDSYILVNSVQIFFSLFMIVLPFAIGGMIIKLFVQKDIQLLPLQKPNSGKMFVAALGISFLTLVVSNFVTSMFVLASEGLGFQFDGGTGVDPENFEDFMWQVLSTAIVPALAEEFAVRGVVLQSLRRFGDTFAIITSAFIFAIMHGNLVQAPFALMLGLVMAWLVIVTDSLWTGIAIHFMNNLYATIVSALSVILPEIAYVAIVAAVNVVGAVLGLVAFIWFIDKYKKNVRLNEPGGNTKSAQKMYRRTAFRYTVFSLPMLAALIIMFVEIGSNVHYIG